MNWKFGSEFSLLFSTAMHALTSTEYKSFVLRDSSAVVVCLSFCLKSYVAFLADIMKTALFFSIMLMIGSNFIALFPNKARL